MTRLSETYTVAELAKKLGVSPATVYRAHNQDPNFMGGIKICNRLTFPKRIVDAKFGKETAA